MIKKSKLKKNNTAFEHVEFIKDNSNLKKIMSEKINLLILQRSVNEQLEKFVQDLDLRIFPSIHTSFYAYESKAVLHTLLKDIATDKKGLILFINDLKKMISYFCALLNTELVRFSLQKVEDDMCRYFHCDYTNLRLVCTYAGPGTYWTPNANVNRDKLGSGCNGEIIRDPNEVYQLEKFWMGIFKGEVFMNNAGNGIVHRSPEISRTGEKRILLRLDA